MIHIISTNMVDLVGIDKEVLLETLWKNSKPIAFYRKCKVKPPIFDIEKAMSQVKEDGFADYILGRLIKINLYNDTVDPTLYNENNGEKKLSKIIAKLKN